MRSCTGLLDPKRVRGVSCEDQQCRQDLNETGQGRRVTKGTAHAKTQKQEDSKGQTRKRVLSVSVGPDQVSPARTLSHPGATVSSQKASGRKEISDLRLWSLLEHPERMPGG